MPLEELEKRLKAEKAHQQTVDNTVQLSADRTVRALGVAESIYRRSGLKQLLDKFKVLVGSDTFYLYNPDPNIDPLKAFPGAFRHLIGRRRGCFYDAAIWPLPLYQPSDQLAIQR